jgi:hypothetical protein
MKLGLEMSANFRTPDTPLQKPVRFIMNPAAIRLNNAWSAWCVLTW